MVSFVILDGSRVSGGEELTLRANLHVLVRHNPGVALITNLLQSHFIYTLLISIVDNHIRARSV